MDSGLATLWRPGMTARHIVTTRYSSSTLTGNVSATYGPSTSCAPVSTFTSKRRTWTRRGSHQDLPVRMSYSQECHGQRITSPLRESQYSPGADDDTRPV